MTHDITKYCRAAVFSEIGKRTPVAVRFSTVGGESGSADTARDPRGYAVKMYTEEGNWDLVGNNTPIFFLRDPILFPSFIHTQKRNPATHLKVNFFILNKNDFILIFYFFKQDPDMFWDFITLRPETTHQVSFLFSDRGTPDGYRFMNGYGSHTFKMVNAKGEPIYCKFHFKVNKLLNVLYKFYIIWSILIEQCDQGIKNLPPADAHQLTADDPDYSTRDL